MIKLNNPVYIIGDFLSPRVYCAGTHKEIKYKHITSFHGRMDLVRLYSIDGTEVCVYADVVPAPTGTKRNAILLETLQDTTKEKMGGPLFSVRLLSCSVDENYRVTALETLKSSHFVARSMLREASDMTALRQHIAFALADKISSAFLETHTKENP